jgi:hypothetical protein
MPSEIDPHTLQQHAANQERLRDPATTGELLSQIEKLITRFESVGALEQAQHCRDVVIEAVEAFPEPRNSTQVQLMNMALESHLAQYRSLLP